MVFFDEQTFTLDDYIIMTDNPKKSETFSTSGMYFTLDSGYYIA